MESPLFFEGAEKKLEVYLKPELEIDLMTLPESFWEGLVHSVNAKILSKIESEDCKAFLLSESSLFVYKSTFTMITCGTTQLVNAVSEFLKSYKAEDIEALFYERKNEIFGHYQPSHFFDDVRELRKYIEGKAYRFGEESEHHVYLFTTEDKFVPDEEDCTLEILMNGLQGTAKDLFLCGQEVTAMEIREKSGLSEVLAGYSVNDYVFSPCGYSLNALKGNCYATIHVTPEAVGSYASFETNAATPEERKYWIDRIIGIFKPTSFDVLVFDDKVTTIPEIETYSKKSVYSSDLKCGFQVQYSSYYYPQDKPQKAYEYGSEI